MKHIYERQIIYFAIFSSAQNKRRENFVQRETNLTQGRGRREIILTKHVKIMILCFKNLGIMNLCTSARES